MFKSFIHSVYVASENVYLVTLAMPKTLENRQKRSSLRISPPYHAVAGAAFWYGENMPKAEEMNDITLWKSPLLFYIKDKVDQFSITNISTGGIRLNFPLKVLQLHDIHISSIDHFLLMLDLIQSDSKELLRVWLQCRIQSVTATQESKRVFVGAQFLAWGKPRSSSQENDKIIDWLRTSSTREVEALAQWITQCHLEQTRTPQT